MGNPEGWCYHLDLTVPQKWVCYRPGPQDSAAGRCGISEGWGLAGDLRDAAAA